MQELAVKPLMALTRVTDDKAGGKPEVEIEKWK
jgi:hypothetical protein